MDRYYAFLIIANIWIVGCFCGPTLYARVVTSVVGLVWLLMAIIILYTTK